MRTKYLHSLIFPLLASCAIFSGCGITSEIDYPIEFEGDRLIIFSHLELDEPITARVWRTSHPLDTFHEDSFYIEYAQVIVYENEIPYTFHHTGSGYYETDEEIIVKENHAYRFEVRATDFPDAYSDTEIVPPPGIIKNLQWNEVETNNQNEGILSFEIDIQGENPFIIELEGLYDSNPFGANYNLLTGLGLYCENLILVPECLTLDGKIELAVDTEFRNGSTEFTYTHLISSLSIISPSLKKYMESVSLQFDAFDFPFLPNVSPHTNIHNGYGLISASNRVSAIIAIN